MADEERVPSRSSVKEDKDDNPTEEQEEINPIEESKEENTEGENETSPPEEEGGEGAEPSSEPASEPQEGATEESPETGQTEETEEITVTEQEADQNEEETNQEEGQPETEAQPEEEETQPEQEAEPEEEVQQEPEEVEQTEETTPPEEETQPEEEGQPEEEVQGEVEQTEKQEEEQATEEEQQEEVEQEPEISALDITDEERETFQTLFDMYSESDDSDGIRKISPTNIKLLFRFMGEIVNGDIISQWLQEEDKNNDSMFDFEEFCALYKKHRQPEDQRKEEILNCVNTLFPTNGDNSDSISLNMVSSLLRKLNNQSTMPELSREKSHLSNEDINYIIHKIDTDGSNSISRQEFVEFLSGKND